MTSKSDIIMSVGSLGIMRSQRCSLSLKNALPKFYQCMNFATRGENMLDLVYTNICNAYKVPSCHATPTYRAPLICSALQDRCANSDWNVFTYDLHTCVEEYTDTDTQRSALRMSLH